MVIVMLELDRTRLHMLQKGIRGLIDKYGEIHCE